MQNKHLNNKYLAGIDVGAITIKSYLLGHNGIAKTSYTRHHGHPEKVLTELLSNLVGKDVAIAMTGSQTRKLAESLGIAYVDPAVCLMAAAKDYVNIRHIVDIGGASLSIVDIDENGRFSGYRTNSLCAAGTGSFLDEQATRMKISSEEMLRESSVEDPPRIAARCAVFAKSDLIHRQQEGYKTFEMWSGLCKGMVATALSTLFRGRKPAGNVLLTGGVVKNKEVVKWLRKELSVDLVIPDEPEVFSAKGLIDAARPPTKKIDLKNSHLENNAEGDSRRSALALTLTRYPDFKCAKSYINDGTEVRVHRSCKGNVVIGVDIGSTSTKAVVIDESGNVLADFYRKTSGDPIVATQKIFSAIETESAGNITVLGTGTTGSGRKMIGTIIGADRVVNEITAHVQGALTHDPDVETIFEIGGQDSKFISIRNGAPIDSNMNYVCAAGTGSFVEEQAGKLDIALSEIGDRVMGISPPYSTDRCTVFMEQDIFALIKKGASKEEALGSVLYSVVQNYLNRVVGRRPFSRKKICFMGATARNKGLVAAFENLTGAPISVSPFCHVMGAFGVGHIVLKEIVKKNVATKFIGMETVQSEVKLGREICELCSNKCQITRAFVGSNTEQTKAPSWGYQCGRDPDEMTVRVGEHFDLIRKRENLWKKAATEVSLPKDSPVAAMPRALLTFSYLPMWRRFFAELGVKLITSSPSRESTLERAEDFIGSDYCYPVKLTHGHVLELSEREDVNFIFMPYMTQAEPHDDGFKRSVFCPYNVAFPSIAKIAELVGDDKAAVTPVINMQYEKSITVENLCTALTPVIGNKATSESVGKAWDKAIFEQEIFHGAVEDAGLERLQKIDKAGEKGIVILGRAYNVLDLGANLNIPKKISELSYNVFTADMLPIKDVKIDPSFNNMYWRYGRKLLQAATYIASKPNLYAVFLTNFGCGPDSFLQTYVEKIMAGKPMLMLEFDEHSADAGYITRLEAFRDVIERGSKEAGNQGGKEVRKRGGKENINNLWMPPMHPYSTKLLAAALRSQGIPARELPKETLETFEIAKRYCRGTECVPAPSTIGTFINVLKSSNDPTKEVFFMPTAKGPCRFGQYHALHRIILDEAGYKDTRIESWDDGSGDFGLDTTTLKRALGSIIASDAMYKARCRIRPYAKNVEAFDKQMTVELETLEKVIESKGDIASALKRAANSISKVETLSVRKPLVGIVGEIYVRTNEFTNGELVKTIESAGGEAWVATLSEWFQYLTYLDTVLAKERGFKFIPRLGKLIKNAFITRESRRLYSQMDKVISDRVEPSIQSTVRAGERVFPRQFDGESILTVGRAIEFAEHGVDLIINCAPFGCMPGTLTSGIFQKLEKSLNVPIVSLFFDGETDLSHLVETYVANLKNGAKFKS